MKMMKKRNNKKGFTLIELIVVIAILAILAMIAIPRLAGFTDKAKQANDKELASIAQHSVATLIASGDIKDGSATADGGTLTITINGGSAATIAGYALSAGYSWAGGGTFQAAMEDLIGTDNLQYYTQIVITLNDSGELTSTATAYTNPT